MCHVRTMEIAWFCIHFVKVIFLGNGLPCPQDMGGSRSACYKQRVVGRIKFIQKKFIEEFQNNKYRVIHMCSKSLHVFLLGFLKAIIDGLG